MLDKQFIQDYFNADFRDIDSLLNDVLVPIFGSFDPGYDEITLSRDAKEKAAQSRIKKIKHVATLPAMGMDIKVFDVTLDSRCHIHRARKGIQMLIRQYVEKFEGAFIVFHYEDPANRSWRFSYLEKRESNVASTNAKRYTYLCGKQYPCRTLAERFEGLQKQDLTAINLEKAFSVETLSDEFFNEYRNFYQDLVNFVRFEDNLIDGFVEYAKGDKELAEKYARDYIKKLMGRLVFIQFLQNKAWLKEDIHYTHSLFDACSEKQKENFLDNVLEPLFFGVFNTPKDAREVLFHQEHWDMNLYNEWKDFPYLNGGLFECDELDKLSLPLPSYFFSNPGKEDKVRKPNDEYYSDACGIFDFFDRYNFTIDESDPLDREIGVDPEMLGKIFENLLEDNKDKGAFYTPKEIVDYMCKEALTAYLIDEARKKSEVNKQRQENFEEAIRAFVNDPEMTVKRIQQYDDKQLIDLDESLRDVKICDPAIGSGAFPMGLLNLLMACRTAVNDALRKGEPRYLLKKEIIQNNIYGVDIEKGAIDIARLRFWLSIVVDLEEPEALPNFDYKFMQGNSLLEQYKGVDLSTLTQNKKEQHEALQVSMFDDQLDILRKTLRKHLDDYFLTTDHQIKTRLRQQIKDNVNQQLHEQHIRVDFPEQYDIAANTDFFLWHTWFADVFNRPSKQGFDIVIGNPPYIQLQKSTGKKGIDKKGKEYDIKFADYYVDGHYNTYERGADIYCLFYERGHQLLKAEGHLCYITSNKWMRAGYGEKTRLFFSSNTDPKLLIDFAGVKIFDSATVDTNILLFQKNTNKKHTICVEAKGQNKDCIKDLGDFVSKHHTISGFINADSWVILSEIEQSIKNKIESIGTPLKDWDIQINYGIKTGYNDAFIISTEKREEILSNCRDEDERRRTADLIRPILRGRDIKKYGFDWAGIWLINTHNGVRGQYPPIDIKDYPAVKEHLDKYWDNIQKREDQGDTPYNLRNCAYMDDFFKPKIIYPETTQGAYFVYDNRGFMLDKTCFMLITNDAEYLQLTLSSKLFEFAYKHIFSSVSLGDHGYQYNKHALLKLPIYKPHSSILIEKDKLDKQIYKLYNISEQEIKEIESC